jgi:hypothetical protein
MYSLETLFKVITYLCVVQNELKKAKNKMLMKMKRYVLQDVSDMNYIKTVTLYDLVNMNKVILYDNQLLYTLYQKYILRNLNGYVKFFSNVMHNEDIKHKYNAYAQNVKNIDVNKIIIKFECNKTCHLKKIDSTDFNSDEEPTTMTNKPLDVCFICYDKLNLTHYIDKLRGIGILQARELLGMYIIDSFYNNTNGGFFNILRKKFTNNDSIYKMLTLLYHKNFSLESMHTDLSIKLYKENDIIC